MAIDLRLPFPGRPVARPGHDLPARALSALRGVVQVILRWREVRRQRRALLALSDQLLKDIGISRADAFREASRLFWDTGGESWRGWR